MEDKKYYIKTNEYADTCNALHEITQAMAEYGWERTNIPVLADLAFSVGGDGTFIDTAKEVAVEDVPIIGINKGTLGYLTEVNESNIRNAIRHFMDGNVTIQDRMRLKNASLCSVDNTVLNDIAIVKDGSSVINIEVAVNGDSIARYYADGVIVSTPTGSTGYAFSCGAPIIDPASEMIIITPIAPHTVMNRSICLSPDSIVSVKLLDARNAKSCAVEMDGEKYALQVGQTIIIKKSIMPTKYVSFPYNEGFLDRVMKKMGNF